MSVRGANDHRTLREQNGPSGATTHACLIPSDGEAEAVQAHRRMSRFPVDRFSSEP